MQSNAKTVPALRKLSIPPLRGCVVAEPAGSVHTAWRRKPLAYQYTIVAARTGRPGMWSRPIS